GVAFSPDGQTLATVGGTEPPGRPLGFSGDDRAIRFWDVRTGRERTPAVGYRAAIRAVCYSPDGKVLAAGGEQEPLYLWEVATGKALRRLGDGPLTATSIAFTLDGRTLATSGE